VPVRFSLFSHCRRSGNGLHTEEVEEAETHEMDILGPRTSAASSLRSVSTGQDINHEAQSVISQIEGMTFICPCLAAPSRDDYFVLLQDLGETTSLG
jgi:hypothetical protein